MRPTEDEIAKTRLAPLQEILARIPAVQAPVAAGVEGDGWWVKFGIDIHHQLAWSVVQELGCVLNYLSLEERLPTIFKPVSPAPYLNGGPTEYLSWVIECHSKEFTPSKCAEWIEGRLPQPINDVGAWPEDLY